MILKLIIVTSLVTDVFGGMIYIGDGQRKNDNCEFTFECPKSITDLAKRSTNRVACIQATDPVCKDKQSNIRTIDGSCNNEYDRGAAMDTVDRVIPNAYGDNFGSPRILDSDGNMNPSARRIVEEIFTDEDKPANVTMMVAQYGQFLSHDILDTITGSSQDCCNGDAGCPPVEKHPSCLPIATRNETSNRTECTNFVRSQAANCTNSCKVGIVNNINRVTSFMELSTVYGSDKKTAAAVRAFVDGKLKTEKTEKGDFLPNTCNGTRYCPLAGDGRVNQQSFLTTVHTIFLRAHNAIARKLKELFPNLTDEQIFQQARKILISIYQHTVYNHYLVHLLGEGVVDLWKLRSTTGRSKYDSSIDPRIIHEFGDACNRFGHSQFPGKILLAEEIVLLRNYFGRGDLVPSNFTDFIRALIGYSETNTTTGSQTVDYYFTEELTKFLFFSNVTRRGGNLPATNIQRGRDHGTPLYESIRRFCCLPNVTGFDDRDVFGDNGAKLKTFYKSVKDLEAYPALLAERIKSGLVPETIACIVALQYYRLKYGDRSFFDTSDRKLGWPKDEQLVEIRKTSLSFILCLTFELLEIQKDCFLFPSETNKYVKCADLINTFDFSKFKP